ncbi:MAG: type II secretion system GspH family protein [Gemmatimonadaceae bacterium]|nr:type II secretion system GspH family protein [Gemmatimonadaceae bacterium]
MNSSSRAARRRACLVVPVRRRAAFTVIELVMVVVMIGLLSAVALPRLNNAALRADAGVRLVRTLLSSQQRNSITRQSNVIVSFDLTNSRLRIVEDYNNNDTLNTTDRVQFRALGEGVRFRAPTMGRIGGTASSTALVGTDLRTVSAMSSVIFRRDGSASTDVELYLANRATVSSDYRAVVINPATGRVDMWRYTGTAWVRMTN